MAYTCIRHWCIVIDTIRYNEKLYIQKVTVLRSAANNYLSPVSWCERMPKQLTLYYVVAVIYLCQLEIV